LSEVLLALDRTRPRLGEQLVSALRAAIGDGRLGPGARLPSSRELAAELGVSRGLVVSAYEQLVAEGRLVARRGAGTVVGPLPGGPPEPGHGADRVPGFIREGEGILRPGVPDLGRFPRQVWLRAYERALRTVPDSELGYGDPAGALRLRAELAGYLARVRVARVDPATLVVTTGAAQAFTLVARALRGEDRIGVEDPGSPVIWEHLRSNGLTPVPVPVDEDGLDVAALRRLAVPAVVVTPAHQYPTGVVLSPRRRAELVGWARDRAGLIIEDDYDAEFRYDREPVGCLQGTAPDVVALIGSASKALAPALRLGWLATPPRLAAATIQAKDVADHGGPVLEQLAFAELLAGGGYDRHLRQVRRAYRQRRDAVLAAIQRHLPEARVRGVAAGLHLVVELQDTVDDVALAKELAGDGIAPWPLSRLRAGTPGPPGLLIGYASHSVDQLAEAIHRLAIRNAAARSQQPHG
jgi:GntR family transcriptional regulator/MocR family aminotransferase